MILVFWSMNLSYSPHQSYPSGNQDWAVQAAALSKNPFLEIAGLKKRVGYAWYFGYFEWVRWTVMLPVMEENPALPLIWIFINWWLGARFLLSTVLRPSCSLGLVMDITFHMQVAEREKLHQLCELDVAREEAKFSGEVAWKWIFRLGISPRSPSISGEVGGWWNMNQIFTNEAVVAAKPMSKQTYADAQSDSMSSYGFFPQEVSPNPWVECNMWCLGVTDALQLSERPRRYTPLLVKMYRILNFFVEGFGAAAFSSGAKIEDFFHQRSTFSNSFLIFGMVFVCWKSVDLKLDSLFFFLRNIPFGSTSGGQ